MAQLISHHSTSCTMATSITVDSQGNNMSLLSRINHIGLSYLVGKRRFLSFALVILLSFCFAIPGHANSKNQKTILILNSYNEDELWGNKMVQPLMTHMMFVDSIKCETTYFTNFLINDSITYNEMSDHLFERYRDNVPACIVMVGNFVFNLRDRIKREWGDVPFILISRIEGFGPLEDYFASNTPNAPIEQRTPIASVRDDYNFTAILVPDYPKATVDLMVKMLPQMEKLVFMSDPSYVNRVASTNLYNYILEVYPQISYKWLIASEETSDDFRIELSRRDPNVGYLLSSWAYETKSLMGYPLVTTRDLNYISSSVDPVFSLRLAYLSLGCMGGVFSNNDVVKQVILERTEAMLRGENMKNIPFFYPSKGEVIINYRRLHEYGIEQSSCPKGTIFYSKTPSNTEQYIILGLIILAFVAIIIIFLIVRNRLQSRQITLLKRHREFVDNMPLPYCSLEVILNRHDRLVDETFDHRNKAYIELVNENSVPDDPVHLLPSKLVAEKTRELMEQKGLMSMTYYLECSDTYYDFMFYLTSYTERPDGTKAVKVDVFARDITEQHKTQLELRKATEVLEMAIRMVKIIPWQLDWKTKTITLDIGAGLLKEYWMDYDLPRFSLSDYYKLVIPEDRHLLQEAYEALENGRAEDFMLVYRSHIKEDDPRVEWVKNVFKVIEINENGSVSKVLGTLQFITSDKEHEEKLKTALKKAQESDRMKSIFLANMSHEIRTPLNAIVGMSNLLLSVDDEAEKKQLADVITYNNELLLNLISDILDLAKIESNSMDFVESDCDVEQLLESVGRTISVRIPPEIKFNILHYSDYLNVQIDSNRVSQILINFLTNACKFTHKGTINLGVDLREAEGTLYFFVKDTGIGIAKENQNKIFERFVKLDQFTQGTGLGLSICKSLVKCMGGEIGVRSDGEGCGSTFWFTIPYKPIQQ